MPSQKKFCFEKKLIKFKKCIKIVLRVPQNNKKNKNMI